MNAEPLNAFVAYGCHSELSIWNLITLFAGLYEPRRLPIRKEHATDATPSQLSPREPPETRRRLNDDGPAHENSGVKLPSVSGLDDSGSEASAPGIDSSSSDEDASIHSFNHDLNEQPSDQNANDDHNSFNYKSIEEVLEATGKLMEGESCKASKMIFIPKVLTGTMHDVPSNDLRIQCFLKSMFPTTGCLQFISHCFGTGYLA